MSPRRLWRRMVALWRRRPALPVPLCDQPDVLPPRGRVDLANELLETVSPSILFSAGHLRYRRVHRRRVRYARLRQGSQGPLIDPR